MHINSKSPFDFAQQSSAPIPFKRTSAVLQKAVSKNSHTNSSQIGGGLTTYLEKRKREFDINQRMQVPEYKLPAYGGEIKKANSFFAL
jgi:hypothetical protein